MSDYAFLVGISRYPNPGFCDLEGPPHDVELFEAWLRSPEGGGIGESDRIHKLISPVPYPDPFQPDEAPPTESEFRLRFRRFASSLTSQPARRLYLFFSGHGFSERQRLDPHANLYTADADDQFPESIPGTYYAQMALRKGWFREVVLVMDCCRDSEINRLATKPAMDQSSDEGATANGKLLAFYAAPFGGKAQERPIPEEQGTVHGLLTYALVDALKHAPRDAAGRFSGYQLKNYLYAAWDQRYGEDAPDKPKIQLPDGEDIDFQCAPEAPPAATAPDNREMATHSSGQSRGYVQQITLEPPVAADLVVSNAQFEKLFTCVLLGTVQQARIEYPDGTTAPLEFDGQTLTLHLPGGMYLCEIAGAVPARETTLIVRGDGHAAL